jgi:serine/threonine-protein kinase
MPQKFGRFWLHEKIGHGGMAEIFRASVGPDPDTYSVEVAVKRLHTNLCRDSSQVDMFLTEADLTKFLDHPNILHVYEAGFVDEVPFIAMDYVWGIDLSRLMDLLRRRRGRFPADLAVHTAMQVLRGVDYVHRAKSPGGEPMEMVHRDITPPNLFITFGGEVKIGDFGIARVKFIEPTEDRSMVKGKPAYIPPEVLEGAPVSQLDDLWGLAICLYEMLTGQPVYPEIDPNDIRDGTVRPKIQPIHRVNPDIDEALSSLLARALSPKPKKRFQDASLFYRELKRYLVRQGIQVGKKALAAFVRGATGITMPVPAAVTDPAASAFEISSYTSPIGPSLTQRFEVRRRQRLRFLPLLIGAAVLAIGAGLYLYLR